MLSGYVPLAYEFYVNKVAFKNCKKKRNTLIRQSEGEYKITKYTSVK